MLQNLFFEMRPYTENIIITQYFIADRSKNYECTQSLHTYIVPEGSLQKIPHKNNVPENFSFEYFCSIYSPEKIQIENKDFIETYCVRNLIFVQEQKFIPSFNKIDFISDATQFIMEKISQLEKLAIVTPDLWFSKFIKNFRKIDVALKKQHHNLNNKILHFI